MTRLDAIVTLFVCLRCDRDAARFETAEAEGRGWFKILKQAFADNDGVQVRSTNCMGGCECSGMPNGCCSVGLVSEGKYGFVLNQLNPESDTAKLEILVQRYQESGDGRLKCGNEPDLLRHIATRLPPLKSL